MTPAQKQDVQDQLPTLPADEQDSYATKPITPVADDDAALDAHIDEYKAVVRLIEHFEETDDGHAD